MSEVASDFEGLNDKGTLYPQPPVPVEYQIQPLVLGPNRQSRTGMGGHSVQTGVKGSEMGDFSFGEDLFSVEDRWTGTQRVGHDHRPHSVVEPSGSHFTPDDS